MLRRMRSDANVRKPAQEMMENVRRHLRRRQRQPQVVQRFFHEKHVIYAA